MRFCIISAAALRISLCLCVFWGLLFYITVSAVFGVFLLAVLVVSAGSFMATSRLVRAIKFLFSFFGLLRSLFFYCHIVYVLVVVVVLFIAIQMSLCCCC